MLEALALHFHRGEDQAVPYEMRGVSYSLASFKTGNTRIDTTIMHISNLEENKISKFHIDLTFKRILIKYRFYI